MLFREVGVDAGLIMIADEDFFKSLSSYKFESGNSRIFSLEPGNYHTEWSIDDTYNGDVSGDGLLKVTSGRVIVSDPCYLVDDHDEWIKLLDKYDFFNTVPEGTLVLDSMGGDGCYDVEVSFRKY